MVAGLPGRIGATSADASRHSIGGAMMLYFNDCWRKFQLVSFLLVPLFLFIFSFSGIALGSEVLLAWTPNSEADLAGYKIHYGSESANYTNVVDVGNPTPEDGKIKFSIDCPDSGQTYYLAATAYNDSGLESEYCPEVIWKCPATEPDNTLPTAGSTSVNTLEDNAISGNLKVVHNVNTEKCLGCGLCAQNCPKEAITLQ